jgi:acyl-CoA thioesterase
MGVTTLSSLLDRTTVAGDSLVLDVPDDWAQGRSIFGGLQAALVVRAMRTLVPQLPLRTLQITFIAPVSGRMRAAASVLRQGGSAIHVEATLFGSDDTRVAIAVGVFGKARVSAVAVMPSRPDIETAQPIAVGYEEGVVPAFLQHFTATWLRGTPPFTGGTETRHVIEVGIDDVGLGSEAHAIALADYVPPLGLTMLRSQANGSTLTWMLEFTTERFAHPLAGWRVDTDLLVARDGYTNQAVRLWAPDGSLVALGHQSMVVFG